MENTIVQNAKKYKRISILLFVLAILFAALAITLGIVIFPGFLSILMITFMLTVAGFLVRNLYKSTYNAGKSLNDENNDGIVDEVDYSIMLAKRRGEIEGIAQAEREKSYNMNKDLICPQCGARNSLESRFCNSCGAQLK